MNDHRKARSNTVSVDIARDDPGALYDEAYYQTGCDVSGEITYARNEHFLNFFGTVADNIVAKYQPKTFLDVGCAFGMLVEALVDRGVDAYGFDISPYAISQARPDIADRLSIRHITEPLPLLAGSKRYDMVSCIEVVEHLPPEQTDTALAHLCDAADLMLFSSSPDDHDEPTHFNVRTDAEWKALLRQHRFVPVKKSKAAYLAPHAFVAERLTPRTSVKRMFRRLRGVNLE